MPRARHPNTNCYSFAAAIAASGHPRPRAVLNVANTLRVLGNLPPRAQGVTAAMRALRTGGGKPQPWLNYSVKLPR
jgi:hypothetical protein